MGGWIGRVKADPLPWLLDESMLAVRHLALRTLLDRGADDPEVVAAREAATRTDPIASILAAQSREGWWAKPGHGYGPKYTGTVWQVIFLDQLGADGDDPRVRAACEYVLDHTQTSSGGLGCSGGAVGRPAPSSVVHCLHGNLLRALVGFGLLDDPRVQRALSYQAASITGEGWDRWYASTPGPGFRCGANCGDPCAWGATKAVLALARVPAERRTPAVARALEQGATFLLVRDPSVADYPMGPNTKPNGSWFKLGFPSGYVADVLQVLEALCEAGMAADPRLDRAVDWVVAQQDAQGRWPNRYAYAGKMVIDIDRPGLPSKWVTLRACRVLKSVAESRSNR
ncbi:MAG: nitrogen fixation protein NifH [Candidatus Limnocylindrales bacterium]